MNNKDRAAIGFLVAKWEWNDNPNGAAARALAEAAVDLASRAKLTDIDLAFHRAFAVRELARLGDDVADPELDILGALQSAFQTDATKFADQLSDLDPEALRAHLIAMGETYSKRYAMRPAR